MRPVLRHLALHSSRPGSDLGHEDFCARLLEAERAQLKEGMRRLLYLNGQRLLEHGVVARAMVGEAGAWFGLPDGEVAEVRLSDDACEAWFTFRVRGYPERQGGRYDRDVRGSGIIRVDGRLAASFSEVAADVVPRQTLPGDSGPYGGASEGGPF